MGKQQAFISDVAIKFSSDECLVWPHERNWKGYGRIKQGNRRVGAHRVVCVMAHGSPPSENMSWLILAVKGILDALIQSICVGRRPKRTAQIRTPMGQWPGERKTEMPRFQKKSRAKFWPSKTKCRRTRLRPASA